MKRILDPEFKKKVSGILSELKKSLYGLYDAATLDDKTGAYNSRFFNNIFEMEIEKAKRGKQKLSVIVLDIDFFKKINDSHGHLTGDKILARLVEALKSKLRKYDCLARFGGEEFVVLLPQTDSGRALKVAERLRRGVLDDGFLKKYSVSISLGVTQYRDKDSIKRMISRADKALYKSKKSGRNKATRV